MSGQTNIDRVYVVCPEWGDLRGSATLAEREGKTLLIGDRIKIDKPIGTISCPVRFEGDGAFDLQPGGSVTVSGAITTGNNQIFYSNGGTISVADKADPVTPQWFGAKGNGTNDDTSALQNAISTGKNVDLGSSGTYKITNSLYANTNGQEIRGSSLITMDAGLAKPCLWVGATNAAGALPATAVVGMKLRGVRFSGTGTKTIGSAGIAFGKATTTTVDSLFAWNFYAGIDIRGTSLANTVINPDLRLNVRGVYDRANAVDGATGPDFQASVFVGGRIEANSKEGVYIGSPSVRFIGTVIEGNGAVANGGTGADPEVRITPGHSVGPIDFTDCYMETVVANTSTAMIIIDALTNRRVTISGGSYYAADAANRYIVEILSSETTQSVTISGGQFSGFKNYIKGSFINNSYAVVMPSHADNSRDVTADLSATLGASTIQYDRSFGLKVSGAITVTGADTLDAIKLGTNGARLHLGNGAADYLRSDGTNIISAANFVVPTVLATGVYGVNSAISATLRGLIADGAAAIGTRLANSNALSTTGAKAVAIYRDNLSNEVASVRKDANTWGLRLQSPDGTWYLLTIANGGTVSIAANP